MTEQRPRTNNYNLEIWRVINPQRKKAIGKLSRDEWEKIPFYTNDYHLYPAKTVKGLGGIEYSSFLGKCLTIKKADYQKIEPFYVDIDRKMISFWSQGQLWDYKIEPIKEHSSSDGLGGKQGWFLSDRVFKASIHPDHLAGMISKIKKTNGISRN